MSRPIFSREVPVEVGVLLVPPPRAKQPGPRTLKPGQRIIDGRVFYSATWLDQATSALSEPPALKCWADAGREREAVDDPPQRLADGTPPSAPGLGARVVPWSAW